MSGAAVAAIACSAPDIYLIIAGLIVLSQEIIQSFYEAMCSSGCSPENISDIQPIGEDFYYRLLGDRKDKRGGACLTITPDGFAYGNFISFKTGDKGSWFSGKGVKTLSKEERSANEARYKQLEAERKAKVEIRHAAAAIEAKKLWDACKPVEAHPYLVKKGIDAHGARIDGDDLIYPGYSNGKIFTYQRIQKDGTKLFLAGARKQGTYFPLTSASEPKNIIVICEGVGTAASIRQATLLPVLSAFDAGNLQYVAKEMRNKYPDSTIILAADNDKSGEKNTGILSAQQAATKYSGFVIWPVFEDGSELTDWNDYHQIYGLESVKEKIMSVINNSTKKEEIIEVVPSWEPDGLVPFDIQIESGKLSPVFEDKKVSNTLLWKKWPSEMDNGKLEPNSLHNILVFMRHKPKYAGLFRYDKFAGRIILYKEPFWHSDGQFRIRELWDADISYITASMEKEGLSPTGAKVHEAINVVARENWIDPPIEYFNSLKWDGVKRNENWLKKYLGATGPDSYLSAIGTAFTIAIVARQFDPGCKAENMLVLEGTQGLLKSSALRALADVGRGKDRESYFCDTLSFDQLKDKDSVLKMQGKTIIEIPDLAGLDAYEIEDVKARMSIEVDEIRVPYGREMAKFPRRFVWAGSTNETHWLKDQTGNRRFWPVDCGKIDIESLRNDASQIIAEAVYLYKNKEKWWIGRDDPLWKTVEEQQDMRLLEDIWATPVEKYLDSRKFVTINEVLDGIGIKISDQKKGHQKQIIGILKKAGYKASKKWNAITLKQDRGWERINDNIVDAEYEEVELEL